MPLPKKYHAITFMSILVMLLLLGLYLLSGGYTQTVETAESRSAALARGNSSQHLQLPSSSNTVFSSQQSTLPAYRHPIVYDKLTGATNNQINDVLGAAGKHPNHLISDYPIDHYHQQQQQQQQQPQPQQFHPGQNLLADAQQQQRHRQEMLDRQMLFGAPPSAAVNPFGPPVLPPMNFPPNQTNANYYPDPALFRQQPMMAPPFSMQPPPPPPAQSQRPQQQQPTPQQSVTNQAPIGPPYAHLNMAPISQNEQQQQQPAAAQSRNIIPLNSRIDPTSSAIPVLVGSPSGQQQQQQPQTVSASNQTPSRTSNSFLSPLQATTGNSAAAAAGRFAPAVPACVRQQIEQQQQQQVPNNDTTTRLQMPVLFCNIDPEYPIKEIMRALELYAQEQRTIEHLMPQLLVQLHIQAQPARQPGGNHQLITLDQLQSSLLPISSANSWQNSSSSGSSVDKQQPAERPTFPSANYEQMCRSTIQMAQPKRAKNLAGQWKIVVNLPGHKYRGIAISQMVRVEECSAPLSECATPSKPSIGLAKSSCLQHFENQRLVSWSPQQGLHVDMFRMPVACSCHIRRSPPAAV